LYDIRREARDRHSYSLRATIFLTTSTIEAVKHFEERMTDYDVSKTSEIFHRDYVFAF
jgi:hypothetical protein